LPSSAALFTLSLHDALPISVLFGIGAAAILLLILYFATVKIVPAGNVGVVTNFGAVQKDTFDPGLHFVTPFVQNVHQVNTQVQADRKSTRLNSSHQIISYAV